MDYSSQNYGLMKELAKDAARKFTGILMAEVKESSLPGTGLLEKLQFFSQKRIQGSFEAMYLAAVDAVYFQTKEDERKALDAYRDNPRNRILLDTAARDELDKATLKKDMLIIRYIAQTPGKSVDDILLRVEKKQIADLASASLKEQHKFIQSSSYTPGGIIGAMLKPKLPEIKRVDQEATQKIHDFVLKKIEYLP